MKTLYAAPAPQPYRTPIETAALLRAMARERAECALAKRCRYGHDAESCFYADEAAS